jgi:mono/diheme cytochrome c family protein
MTPDPFILVKGGTRMRTSNVMVAVAGLLIAMTQLSAQLPQTGPSSDAANVSLPSGNVEHGRYLVERVVMCVECHSMRDEAGNIIQSEKYLGGSIPFAPPWPNNWAMRAPRNRGLVGYDDKAALRLLTQGAIGRDGHQLRPPMPRFHMTPQDAADVIAFLRSLK